MAAITFRMPYGIRGEVTRKSQSTIESGIFNSSYAFGAYGLPGKIASGKFLPIASGDLVAKMYGFLVRPYPITGANASDALGTAVPPTTGMADILWRGYMNVMLNSGTAALGGAVYCRNANPSGAKVIGGIEAAAEQTVAGGTITGTGTGTIAATVAEDVIAGTWSLVLQTTSQTSKVTVIDPLGIRHADATVGTAYTSGGLTFTITANGTMTAADSFAPVVSVNTFKIPNCFFQSAASASGNVEISFNL